MIVIVVKLTVSEEKKEELIAIIQHLVTCSQKEAGNIEYNLYANSDNANSFTIIEKWKDQAAFDFHEHTEHFVNNIDKLVSLCSSPPVMDKLTLMNA